MSVNLQTHSTTNKLLLFLVVPLVFHLMKTLSFIFIPLVSALLIALLFMPFLRWLAKKKISKSLSVVFVFGIILTFMFSLFFVLQLSAKEVLTVDPDFWFKISVNINKVLDPIFELMGIQHIKGEDSISSVLHSNALKDAVTNNLMRVLGAVKQGASMFLMAIFFLILLMGGSINVQKIMESTIFKKRIPSMKTFVILEKSITKFLFVKVLTSIATGIAFGFICYMFDVKFPVFWGLITFALNFIQIIGTVITIIFLMLFAFVQIDQTSMFVLFFSLIMGFEIAIGSILEPILMGKTFSINTITILVMLMLWGYLWGIPGMVLSVPITVALKTILDQFPKTKILADIMS